MQHAMQHAMRCVHPDIATMQSQWTMQSSESYTCETGGMVHGEKELLGYPSQHAAEVTEY